jgi:hypothetical protein
VQEATAEIVARHLHVEDQRRRSDRAKTPSLKVSSRAVSTRRRLRRSQKILGDRTRTLEPPPESMPGEP